MTNTNEIEAATGRAKFALDMAGDNFSSVSIGVADLRLLLTAASRQGASPAGGVDQDGEYYASGRNPGSGAVLHTRKPGVFASCDNMETAKLIVAALNSATLTSPATIKVEEADRYDWPQKSAEEISDIIREAYLAGATDPSRGQSATDRAYDYMMSVGPIVMAAPATSEDGLREAGANLEDVIATEWQTIVEMDDRTSPAEYPDMALITRDELADAMYAAHSAGRLAGLEEAAVLSEAIGNDWHRKAQGYRKAGNNGPYLGEPSGFSIAAAIRAKMEGRA